MDKLDGEASHSETTIIEDVEYDSELKQKLLNAKKDVLEGRVYTTDDVLKLIEKGEV